MNKSKNAGNLSRITGARIYTDGGAHNTGPLKGAGSWAFAVYDENITDKVYVTCGAEIGTTNNRTEMIAVINAIKSHDEGTYLDIMSDSGYVVKGFNHPSYLDKWVSNGWLSSTKEPIMNRDLWEQLLLLSYRYGINFKLIRGHNKDTNIEHAYWNSIVDGACTYVIRNNILRQWMVLEYNIKTKEYNII